MLTKKQEEAMDHSVSLCITAGAGTGKTKVLVEKYIDILERVEGVGIDNILAITFTEKAAAEMKERVRQEIFKKKGPKWKRLQDDFIWAQISTIHSFCNRVIRDFPLETGVDPNFAVLDELETRRMLDSAMGSLLRTTEPTIVKELTELLRENSGRNVKDFLFQLYYKQLYADSFFRKLDKKDEEIIAEWSDYSHKRLAQVLDGLRSNDDVLKAVKSLSELSKRYPGNDDSGMKFLREIEGFLGSIDPDEALMTVINALCRFNGAKGTKAMGSKKHWREQDLNELRRSYSTVKDFAKDLTPILELQNDDEDFLRYTLAFFRKLNLIYRHYLRIVERKKKELGAIDFTDMLTLAHGFFHEHEKLVEKYYSGRFKYILVDEFQDTDPVQSDIIWKLIGDISKGSEKLFVVGDPKQSIYLFRDADVTLFKKTQADIVNTLKGKLIPLDINFRSTPEIICFVNSLFSELLASCERPWEFGYDVIQVSDDRKDDLGSVELLLHPEIKDKISIMVEAEMIARRIQDVVKHGQRQVHWDADGKKCKPRNASYRDITILLQRRTNLEYYEWALRKYEIPYFVYSGIGFYERQEILDVINILRFLENQLDDVAFYGMLRSPYFGVSDEVLNHISKHTSGTLWWRTEKYAQDNNDAQLLNIVNTLHSWLKYTHRTPISHLLGRIIKETGIYAVYQATDGGDAKIANLEKFIRSTISSEGHGFLSLNEFLSDIEILLDGEQRESTAQVGQERGDFVKIMTVHASKGLEFPIVFVPDIDNPATERSHGIMIDAEYGVGVKIPDPARGYDLCDTFLKRLIQHDYKEKIIAERKRLLYVATTRAKDHLFLCGGCPAPGFEEHIDKDTNWNAWLLANLKIDGTEISKGVKQLQFGDTKFKMTIISDPQKIDATPIDATPKAIDIPPAIDDDTTIPDGLKKIEVEDAEHIFSISEIESFIACPQKYYRHFKLGGPDRDITTSSIGESSKTKGLIIHEIFQGKNPELVLRNYGLHDPSKAKEYAEIYSKFLSSDMMKDVVEEHIEFEFQVIVADHPFKGKVDRLVRKTDGSWVIIDYKTGDLKPSDVPKKMDEHSMQLIVYEEAVKQILKAEVKSYIYFSCLGTFHERVGVPSDILKIVSEAAEKINTKQFLYPECTTCARRKSDYKLHGTCPAIV